jgi:predicted nuclease of predicted toxin-antitoxin system
MNGILLDENLPASLSLPTKLPIFAAALLGSSPSDTAMWDYAKSRDLVLVTKDGF